MRPRSVTARRAPRPWPWSWRGWLRPGARSAPTDHLGPVRRGPRPTPGQLNTAGLGPAQRELPAVLRRSTSRAGSSEIEIAPFDAGDFGARVATAVCGAEEAHELGRCQLGEAFSGHVFGSD